MAKFCGSLEQSSYRQSISFILPRGVDRAIGSFHLGRSQSSGLMTGAPIAPSTQE
jgi:hypothetical protein